MWCRRGSIACWRFRRRSHWSATRHTAAPRRAIVPHAPVLLNAVTSGRLAAETRGLRAALEGLELPEADVLVLVSPHGDRSGVYKGVRGSLAGFGVGGAAVDIGSDALAGAKL